MEWKLTHYYEVEDEHYIFWVLGVLPKLCWTEPGVGDHDRCVGAVLVKHPLLGLDVNGLDLEELDDVVEDGEGDDGEDVAETVAHVAMLERQTHGHEPLNRHGNNLCEMSSSCEHFVSLQFSDSICNDNDNVVALVVQSKKRKKVCQIPEYYAIGLSEISEIV